MARSDWGRPVRVMILVVAFVVTAAAGSAKATSCGSGTYPFPYTDVAGVGDPFCPGIMESYVLGVTKGTTATTFSPNANVNRTQMTTFLQRSMDQGLRRNNRRAALGHWWTPKTEQSLNRTPLAGPGPAGFCKSDGEHVWVGNGSHVQSVVARTGQVRANLDLGTGVGASAIGGVLAINGRVTVIDPSAQKLIRVDPREDPPFYGVYEALNVSYRPNNLTFDGDRIWTANFADGTISIVPVVMGTVLLNPGIVVGGFSAPIDVIFDGANVWVADAGTANMLHKVDANGAIVQSVAVGLGPAYMVYDGANIWVPNFAASSITVVQASTGAVVATITTNAANRLSAPLQAAFDGERILVTNSGNDSVTLFRAADLSLIGNLQLNVGSGPIGACSDGFNFWVTLRGSNELLRL